MQVIQRQLSFYYRCMKVHEGFSSTLGLKHGPFQHSKARERIKEGLKVLLMKARCIRGATRKSILEDAMTEIGVTLALSLIRD